MISNDSQKIGNVKIRNMEDGMELTESTCVICEQNKPIIELTADALYADGRQAFACIEHARNRSTWLVAWARFAIRCKMNKVTHRAKEAADAEYGGKVLS